MVFDGEGNQTHRYLHGPQVDQVLAEETAVGETRWTLTDHQDSVRDVIANSGNILNRIVYDSFGQVTSETNPNFDFRFGYTGRERDDAAGLMYYRAHYYDPAVGRFLSEDSLGFDAGDANLYRYVFNGPTNYTDPSGEAAFAPLIFVGGVKAIKAAGAVLALGAGGVLLNNQLQSEETREALEDFAQRCLETLTGATTPTSTPTDPSGTICLCHKSIGVKPYRRHLSISKICTLVALVKGCIRKLMTLMLIQDLLIQSLKNRFLSLIVQIIRLIHWMLANMEIYLAEALKMV
nr:RHS repeat-associated core domain-containing protein [Adonisia turfae]